VRVRPLIAVETHPYTDGPPAKHHRAMTGSQMAQPKDDCGAKGMIGWSMWWCATSHPVCSSQATPIQRQEVSPRYAQYVTTVVKANSA
jgi:hypothetical protein